MTPKSSSSLELWAPETFTLNPDPRTELADSEIQKLLHLKSLAEKLPDGFNNSTRITRNPLPGASPSPITVLPKKHSLKTTLPSSKTPRTDHVSLHSNLSSLSDSDAVLTFVSGITTSSSDPLTLDEAKASSDWPQWSEALKAEYASLRKHNVFGPSVTTLTTKPIGHKLIFTKKRNAQGHVIRYKVRLVAQGFTQRPGVDYNFTYTPVMDSGTVRYLLGMAVQFSLETQLLDVVTAYLYGPLDADIYIKPPPDFFSEIPPGDT